MVRLEGNVQKYRKVYNKEESNKTSRYYVKLKDINSPLYFVVKSQTRDGISDNLKEGDYIVAYIPKKYKKNTKLDFQHSQSFQECAPECLINLPQIYSVHINGIEVKEFSVIEILGGSFGSILALFIPLMGLYFMGICLKSIKLSSDDLSKI